MNIIDFINQLPAAYDEKTKQDYQSILNRNRVSERTILREFNQMGLDAHYLTKNEIFLLFSKIQERYRPNEVTGTLDPETCAICYALYDKYERNKKLVKKPPVVIRGKA